MMTNNLPTAVIAELFLEMAGDSGNSVEVPCALEFRAEEPYAIRATFRTSSADIEWVFARELLACGLHAPSGEGDVRFSPVTTGSRPQLLIALNSPSGRAALLADRASIQHFLSRTYDIVADGDEDAAVHVDRLISAILGEEISEV